MTIPPFPFGKWELGQLLHENVQSDASAIVRAFVIVFIIGFIIDTMTDAVLLKTLKRAVITYRKMPSQRRQESAGVTVFYIALSVILTLIIAAYCRT